MLPNATRTCCHTGTGEGTMFLLLLLCLFVCAAASIRALLAACLACTYRSPGEGFDLQ